LRSRRPSSSNLQIAKDRVLCENFYGRMKKLFSIMKQTYRGNHETYDSISNVCIALTNFHLLKAPLRSEDLNYHQKIECLNRNKGEQKLEKRQAVLLRHKEKTKRRRLWRNTNGRLPELCFLPKTKTPSDPISLLFLCFAALQTMFLLIWEADPQHVEPHPIRISSETVPCWTKQELKRIKTPLRRGTWRWYWEKKKLHVVVQVGDPLPKSKET